MHPWLLIVMLLLQPFGSLRVAANTQEVAVMAAWEQLDALQAIRVTLQQH